MADNDGAAAATVAPLDERIAAAILDAVDVTEDEAWSAVRVLLPLVTAHAHAEYDRGYEYGEHVACSRVADRLGLRLTPAKASERPGDERV